MIKIVASIIDDNGKKHTKSFTTKQNRKVNWIDIDNIITWATVALKYKNKVFINYRITYDGIFNIVKAISSKTVIISENKLIPVLEHVLNQINNNIK